MVLKGIKKGIKEIFEIREGAITNALINLEEADKRLNSVLEERSYLDFTYPNSQIGKRRVAFFENPTITEDRSSRYASQNIVARNEPVRLFVGGDVRKVKLSFTYTIPHIEYFFKMATEEYLHGFGVTRFFRKNSSGVPIYTAPTQVSRAQKLFWTTFTKDKLDKFFGSSFNVVSDSLYQISNEDRYSGPRVYDPTSREPKDSITEPSLRKHLGPILQALSLQPASLSTDLMLAVYYTQFVIDTLRASVIGDTTDIGPAGPPIVRFRHGTVFNEAPFIVKNFSITYPSDKGYEFRTLLPRQVKFSLNLEEFRQTHGSHHGSDNEIVPDASQILELRLDNSVTQLERQKYPKL
jgi:hypothetical protein